MNNPMNNLLLLLYLFKLPAELAKLHLTTCQFLVLKALVDSPMRMHDLGDVTQHAQPALVGVVSRLVARGLVYRVRCKNDRRVVHVTITTSGLESVNIIDQLLDEAMTSLKRIPENNEPSSSLSQMSHNPSTRHVTQ